MKNKKNGQVLLIVVMLLATVLTIVLSASYQAITETKITKMEEDSQRALAAAEAGIEYTLKTGKSLTSIASLGDANSFASFEGQTTIDKTVGREFSSPLVSTDQQYTFYLQDYDEETKTFSTSGPDPYFTGDLTIYWQNGTCGTSRTAPALELTLVYNDDSIQKWAYDPCLTSSPRIENSFAPYVGNYTIDDVNYQLSTDPIHIGDYPQAQLLFVRLFYHGTRLGFGGDADLKPQGTYITSTASTPGKTTKIIRVFHSYPQVQATFFTTRF